MSFEPNTLDYLVFFLWSVVAFLIIAFSPIYLKRWILLALIGRILGTIFFSYAYIYHYKGGDTFWYYFCANVTINAIARDFTDFFKILFLPPEYSLKIYDTYTGIPPSDYFKSDTQWTYIMYIPAVLFSFGSYFGANLFTSFIVLFFELRLLNTIIKLFPEAKKIASLSFLLVPSNLIWTSSLLKESIVKILLCEFFNQSIKIKYGLSKNALLSLFALIFLGFFILKIRVYVVYVLLPATSIFFLIDLLKNIKPKWFAILCFIVSLITIILISVFIFYSMGDLLWKYNPRYVLEKVEEIRSDLVKDYYGGNHFDIGPIEPTFLGVLEKFPIATLSGLFRPFFWELRKPIMIPSVLESIMLFGLLLLVFIYIGPKKLISITINHPVLLFTFLFSILLAYTIGLTTPNFGALVRFKTQFISFFSLFLGLCYILSKK